MATSLGLGEFARRMNFLARGVLKSSERGVRAAAVAGDRHLIETTPVDTGHHRSNWIASIGRPADRVIPGAAKISKSRGLDSVLARYRSGLSVFFSNSAPAILLLDKGSSRQAPSGMSQGAIAVMKSVLRRHKIFRGAL